MSGEEMKYKLLIHSAKQVVQVVKNGEQLVIGKNLDKVAVLDGGDTGISIVVSSDGIISDIGNKNDIEEKYKASTFENIIDATGKCVLPGLVDAHTHPVWAGDRVKEFSMKLAGFSYMDIHKIGGGIYYTVDQTKKTDESILLHLLKVRLEEMLKCGTTLVEAKSGYGLDLDTELKMLRVIEQAKKETSMEISSTYCGAHAVPKHLTSDEATKAIIEDQLPALKKLMESKELKIDNIDVFCEKGVYDVNQSRQILTAGKELGLQINFHGDELNPIGAAEMGASLGATAISHLEEISEDGIRAMAKSRTVAVVLPTTAYMLKLKPPPVKKMIEEGVPVALGSDFNPNAFCLSMPLVMHLACVLCGMSMDQALYAATINSAAALGKSHSHGSIEEGKVADFIIINASRWEHLIYQMGAHNSLIDSVVKRGNIIHKNKDSSFII
ncbi:probable imidazolonepropionase [Parasteatoda tepidariorum]|uniref:probable imidazolonepropionase n=1 Tax=Parasteatoda tepidariorum TaxID=114398 RepID=UPI00077F82E5|nr:probable imidazolonepropionase [Parasteatoda tepidariorum]